MQTKIDNLNNTLQENLVAIRVVKAFVREGYERVKFKKSNDELMDAALAVGLRIIAIMPVMMLALNGATVAVLYFGGGMVMGGTFELGDLQAFINYIVQILMSVMMVAMSLLQLSRAQACAHRIKEVLETEPSVENKPEGEICRAALPGEVADGTDHVLPAPRGEVEFRDVSFHYPSSDKNVLEHITFQAKRGETVAFIGATGSGKTTLVSLAARFYDATEGTVLVDGVDVRDYTFDALYDRIGYVTQKAILFSGDVRGNVLFGASRGKDSDADVQKALELAQASEFVDRMPGGIHAPIAEGGTNVSGGQKQRLSIARALARRPEILVFDDSFSALDYRTDTRLRAGLDRELKDTTRLIVAQRIGTIRNADKIIVLDEGRMVGMGTHEELMQTCPIYQEIARSQLSQEELGA